MYMSVECVSLVYMGFSVVVAVVVLIAFQCVVEKNGIIIASKF